MTLLDSLFIRASLAGLGVALAAAPLGVFVVWRRMAFFGDATAHAAILGVAFALAFDISVFAGALTLALAMGLTVSTLSGRGFAIDTLLGVLAHSSLALGLVAVSFLHDVRFDLTDYLFADILVVGRGDLAIIWGGAVLVNLVIWARWSALLTATVSTDLAYASGLDPKREQIFFTLALAMVVAVSIKVVGVLLIAALLIIPAATARPFANTPERMVVYTALSGAAASLGGVWLSWQLDTPTGPSIVSLAAGLFAVVSIAHLVRHRRAA